MSFRLKPSAFDAARPPLDRIHARGWIWRGRQELDGLCCVKDWFEGEGWIAALTPWLDDTSSVRETDGLVLLTFDKPVECDCASLGRVLPLRRAEGVLGSFPFALSGPSDTIRAALADQLLIVDQGDRVLTPLSAFRLVDIAGWWRFDGIDGEESTPLPQRPLSHKDRASSSSTPFDPDGFGAGLEDIRDRIHRMRQSPVRLAARLVQFVLGSLARIFAWLLILGFVGTILAMLPAGEGIGRVLVYGFALWLYFFFWRSPKLIGPPGGNSQGTGKGSSDSHIATPEYRTGFFRRAAGWLVWNSALGKGVRGKYDRRLRELEELFRKGRVDEALRKAVSLGNRKREGNRLEKRGWFGDFPLHGPDLRKELNVRFNVALAPAYGILTGPGFEAIRELYRKQAEALAESGDFERAAFIYAELLDDPASAVRMFERKGDFETAAKLAQGRRLAPHLFIPLWFRAGQKQRALRLAAQYDAFADLLTHVKDGDPFYRDVVKAWSARLVETGDLLRALELTEKYAEFMPERRVWMLQALDRDQFDAVLAARALKCLSEEHRDRLQALLDRFIAGSGSDHAAGRVRLAQRMADANFEKAATDARYSSARLPLWGLPLLRALLQDEAQHGSAKDRRDAALALSEASGQFALRVDLRRLNRVAALAVPPPARHIVMNDTGALTPIRDAVCVPGNRLLIAYEGGALHLTTMDGRRIWADQIHNFRGFVPFLAGNTVIIVREEVEGTALSLLDLSGRTHKDIGFFRVDSFHRQASEIGWMVFAGGRVLMLDASSLIAAAKNGGGTLEHHWAVPITEPGRLCAFRDHSEQASFLYHREQGGLLELWTLRKSTLKVDCRFIHKGEYKLSADIQTYGWPGGSYFHVCAENGSEITTLIMPTLDYSLQAERRLLAEKKGWLLPQQAISVVSAGGKPLVWCSARTGTKAASVPSTSRETASKKVKWFAAYANALKDPFTVEIPNANRVEARTAGDSSLAAVFDDTGRLAIIDCERGRVLFRNDGG